MTASKSPSSAKKSPVIISQDGEIEKHIDIAGHDKNNSSNTAIEEKEIFVIPHFHDTKRNDTGIKNFFPNYAAYIIVSGIILVVLINRYTNVDVLNYSAPSMDPVTIDQSNGDALRSVIELKDIAKLIIQDTGTDIRTIDSFIDKWILLDDGTKLEFSSSFWFERFAKLLDEKVKSYKLTEAFEDKQTTQYKDALLNMASIIGVVDIGATSAPLNTDEDFEQIFKAISSEIAKAEKKKKDSLEYPPETSTLADEPSTREYILAEQTETPVEEITTIKTSTQGFAEPDINYLLGRYATTYEFGSTGRIMELFSTNSEYKRRLIRSFNKVFSSSSKRRIEFSNLNWTFLDNAVIGNGDYQAYIKLRNNKGTRSINAQVRIKMHVKNGKLRIAKLDFSDVEVNRTKPNNFPHPRKIVKAQKHPIAPTAAELQDVITRFVSAYESGNMKALDSIFSKNAKTNDHNGLKAIKRDYRNLFSSTTDRQLFIKDIKWSFRKNQAQGIGKLNVLLLSKGNSKIRTQQGKINIATKKLNNKVLITHLYHKVSSN